MKKYTFIMLLYLCSETVLAHAKIDSVVVIFIDPTLDFYKANTCIYDGGRFYEDSTKWIKRVVIKDDDRIEALFNLPSNLKLLPGKQCDTRIKITFFLKDKEMKSICLTEQGCIEFGDHTISDAKNEYYNSILKICHVTTNELYNSK